MYSTARKLTAICFILSVISIVGLILICLLFKNWPLEFSEVFSLATFIISITGINLFLTIAIRSTLQDMQLDFESNVAQTRKLNERIEKLNERIEKLEKEKN